MSSVFKDYGQCVYLYFLPMSRSESVVLEILDEWHRPLELVHAVLDHIHNLPVLVL